MLIYELRHFLASRYGNFDYQIDQTGSEARGSIIIRWPSTEMGSIPMKALSAKTRHWFCEMMPGKRISVGIETRKANRQIKITWSS